jgi:hypothetical protein
MQEHYKLFDVGEALEEAVRIRSLEDWNTRGEAAADGRSMALERGPWKHFLNDILRGRQSEGYDCSWGVPWGWATAPGSELQRLESLMRLAKSPWHMLEKVCEKFWSFAEWHLHSSSVTDFPCWKRTSAESSHPTPAQSWREKALPRACHGVGDPSTMTRRPH